jgi:hypothetical protein
MTRDERVQALAELLAGLQVPLSIGILGAAQEPYRRLLNDVPGFGWRTADDFRPYAEEILAT